MIIKRVLAHQSPERLARVMWCMTGGEKHMVGKARSVGIALWDIVLQFQKLNRELNGSQVLL